MSTRMFDKGRENLAGAGNWLTDVIKAMQVALDAADAQVKVITAATNASPIVVTATSHGFTNGDIVVVRGVLGNTAANGTWKIAGVATNTYNLTTIKDGLNSTGNGVYTSGGSAINLSAAASVTDVDAGRNGTDQTLASTTNILGVLDAVDPTFAGVSGVVDAIIIYDNTTSVPTVFIDGKQQLVVAADAASSATAVAIEPALGPIASGVTMVFSNGITTTLTGAVVAGDRTLAVSALSGAIAKGHTTDVATTGGGLPFTGGGGQYTYQFDNGPNRITKI